MRRQHVISFSYLCLLSILTCLIIAERDTTARPLIFDQQTKAWNEIITLYNRGYDTLEKQWRNWDDEELWKQRKTIFTEAANKLKEYIRTYLKDSASVTHLRAMFRLGTYWEIAQNFKSAHDSYLACQKHPLIKDARAIFDEKPLEPQVKERLAEVKVNMGKRYSRKPGYIYVHRGGGNAIFEERDIEFLPGKAKDLIP
jgi:hypothetical protein